jgi:MFS family permease
VSSARLGDRGAARLAPFGVGLAAACLGVFLGALDQTVVATLLPPIVQELQIPFTRLHDAAWIVTGYLLGYTVALPVVGRLADLRGRRRVFAACMVLFVLASVACGAAASLEWLIAARALQAAGGGALLPIALALAGDLPDDGRRNVALGLVAALAEAGGVLGPLYGALFVEWLDWRWVFYLNLPLGLAILVLVLRFTTAEVPSPRLAPPDLAPSVAPGAVPNGSSNLSFDLPGALLLAAGLAALTLALSREGAPDRPAWLTGALLLAAVALLAVFVAVERRAMAPLIDLELFRPPPFAAAQATSLLVGAALIVAMVDLPLWSATVLGRSAADGGLLLLRLTLPIPLGAVLGGLGTRWRGPRAVAVVGLLAVPASFALVAGWPADVPDGRMARDLALGGLGFGLLLAPLAAAAIGWAGSARAGVAASLVVLTRMIGMMVGLSALTSYGLGRFNALVRELPLPLPRPAETAEALARRQADYAQAVQSATVTVFHELFLAAALVCLLALVPALLLRLPPARR